MTNSGCLSDCDVDCRFEFTNFVVLSFNKKFQVLPLMQESSFQLFFLFKHLWADQVNLCFDSSHSNLCIDCLVQLLEVVEVNELILIILIVLKANFIDLLIDSRCL